MLRVDNSLSDLAWMPELAAALERASLAIGRLDARVSASPVAAAWRRRAAWTGYARALQLQSVEIDEIDVFSWGCALPLPARPRRPSLIDEFGPFAPWAVRFANNGRLHWTDGLRFTAAPALDRGAPKLLTTIELVRRLALADATIAPWLEAPMLLQRLHITDALLPCLTLGDKAMRFPNFDRVTLTKRMLRSLADTAETGFERVDALERQHSRSLAALAAEYRPGKLIALLALIQSAPVLSPQKVARGLDVTLSGAGKLLARAAELGLVTEVSGRQSWRVYIPPDLAVAFAFISPPRGRPRVEPPLPSTDRDLAALLEAFDAEMAAFDPGVQANTSPADDDDGVDRRTRPVGLGPMLVEDA